MGLLPSVGRLWHLARQAEDLFKLQDQVKDAVKLIDGRLRTLEDRMTKYEAELPQIVTAAQSAAAAASSATSGLSLTDLVTRLTRVEMQIECTPNPRAAPKKSAPRRLA